MQGSKVKIANAALGKNRLKDVEIDKIKRELAALDNDNTPHKGSLSDRGLQQNDMSGGNAGHHSFSQTLIGAVQPTQP